MKKRRIRLSAIAFAMIFVFTGCGDTLYELTDDEEKLIVNYAAYVVAKYNITQTDGLNSTLPSTETEEEETESQKEAPPETQASEPKPTGNNESPGVPEPAGSISLGDAIGAKDVEVGYKDFYIDSTYQENDYYLLTPATGNKYVVMNFTISNSSAKEKAVNASAENPIFYASFEGGRQIMAESTLLTYSLSTFDGKIKPGKSVKVVLLFQVDSSIADSIKDIKLTVKKGDTTYLVNK